MEFVKSHKLCFNCLKGKHISRLCRTPKVCPVSECKGKHHTLLHKWVQFTNDQSAADSSVNCTTKTDVKVKTCIGIVPVIIAGNNGKTYTTHALLDDGADKSMCDERLLKILDIESRPVTFKVTTMTSNEDTMLGNEVDLHVRPVNGDESIRMSKVWSVKRLPVSTRSAAPRCEVEKYDYLADISVPEIDHDDVMLLIGSDTPFAHIPLEVRAGRSDQPYAIRSSLGWAIRGPLGADIEMNTASIGYHSVKEIPQQQLEQKWTTHFDEVRSDDKSVEDEQAEMTMEQAILYEDVRDNVDLSEPEVVKTVESNLYVDVCPTSVSSEDEVFSLATNLQSSLQQRGFQVTKWKRNKRTVVDAKPEPEVSHVTFREKRNTKLQALCRFKRDRIDPITRTQDREWIGWMKRPPDFQTMYNGCDGEMRWA